jgi:hypothetical protein
MPYTDNIDALVEDFAVEQIGRSAAHAYATTKNRHEFLGAMRKKHPGIQPNIIRALWEAIDAYEDIR